MHAGYIGPGCQRVERHRAEPDLSVHRVRRRPRGTGRGRRDRNGGDRGEQTSEGTDGGHGSLPPPWPVAVRGVWPNSSLPTEETIQMRDLFTRPSWAGEDLRAATWRGPGQRPYTLECAVTTGS